jgi:hypothetical protein
LTQLLLSPFRGFLAVTRYRTLDPKKAIERPFSQ